MRKNGLNAALAVGIGARRIEGINRWRSIGSAMVVFCVGAVVDNNFQSNQLAASMGLLAMSRLAAKSRPLRVVRVLPGSLSHSHAFSLSLSPLRKQACQGTCLGWRSRFPGPRIPQ